ncbi:hypothetical protein BT67DRAFT_193331 [Trichocladium antarcticum]|uniref:Secreted protein n=1 Tax=Trichocladium antarcticum TaxID=1450529 RepID=A0AAN6UPW2_9PEZI|nr:hypothetical protein BT67DRAFT_193331 [Trichocladium antarcticum]
MRTLRRSQGNIFFLWRCLLAESTIEPEISPVDSISPSLPTPRCGLPVCTSSDTVANMSAYYESSQWAPSGQAGWDHQTPPPARSGTFFP